MPHKTVASVGLTVAKAYRCIYLFQWDNERFVIPALLRDQSIDNLQQVVSESRRLGQQGGKVRRARRTIKPCNLTVAADSRKVFMFQGKKRAIVFPVNRLPEVINAIEEVDRD